MEIETDHYRVGGAAVNGDPTAWGGHSLRLRSGQVCPPLLKLTLSSFSVVPRGAHQRQKPRARAPAPQKHTITLPLSGRRFFASACACGVGPGLFLLLRLLRWGQPILRRLRAWRLPTTDDRGSDWLPESLASRLDGCRRTHLALAVQGRVRQSESRR